MNGVIETTTGDLLRKGYVDFFNDGSFDASTESYRTDVPEEAAIRRPTASQNSRWTGSAWEVVDNLVGAKQRKQDEIDARTRVLIGAGFTYDGHQFSLSAQAQQNIVGLKTPIDMGWITFPHKCSTMDSSIEYELADAAAYYAWYAQAVGTIKVHYDSGRALKLTVEACTTVAEVDAVEDNR